MNLQKRSLNDFSAQSSRTSSKGQITRKKNLENMNITDAAITGQNSLIAHDAEEQKGSKKAVFNKSFSTREKTALGFMEILRDFNRHQDDVIQSMKSTCEMGELLSKRCRIPNLRRAVRSHKKAPH